MAASTKRAWIVWAAVAVAIAVLIGGALVWWSHRCPAELGPLVEITCSHQPGNITGDFAWEMTLAADGEGNLIHNGVPRTVSAPKVMQEFTKTLGELHLCDLPAQIGDPVADGSSDLMTIKLTNFERTLGFGYVQPEHRLDTEIVEAQKLWLLAQKAARSSSAPGAPQK